MVSVIQQLLKMAGKKTSSIKSTHLVLKPDIPITKIKSAQGFKAIVV